jgi:hypothetical protein
MKTSIATSFALIAFYVLPSSLLAQSIPARATIKTAGTAVNLYSYSQTGGSLAYIQVVRMDQGARLSLRQAATKATFTNSNSAVFTPGFERVQQKTAWNSLAVDSSKAFSIVNASLFDSTAAAGSHSGYAGAYTGLSLPYRKANTGTTVSAYLPKLTNGTYDFANSTWSSTSQKFVPPTLGYQRLALYPSPFGHFARIETLNTQFTRAEGESWFSSAPATVSDYVPPYNPVNVQSDQYLSSLAVAPTTATQRTIVALTAGTNATGYDVALIFTSATTFTVNTALSYLKDFNNGSSITAYIVFDGGGSSLLTAKGTAIVSTTRYVPTFLAVIDK